MNEEVVNLAHEVIDATIIVVSNQREKVVDGFLQGMFEVRSTPKGDAEEGRVQMSLHGETYERTLTRAGDSVAFDGDGYLDDPDVANLFAFLLETNEAHQSCFPW